jgi:hypothetical protein
MYAFALAECEQTVLGEQMARRAIAIYKSTPARSTPPWP